MPLPILTAHSSMLPRLRAEEALEAAARAALPFLSDSDRRSQLNRWRDEAGGRVAVRPKSREELRLRAIESGIGVRTKR